ncbi:MAG: DUF805 domain-containing protein [Albidovulum sp.]
MSGEIQWFYALGSERAGPVDETVLRGMLEAGEVNGDTLVWTGGMPDWVPMARTDLIIASATPARRASKPGWERRRKNRGQNGGQNRGQSRGQNRGPAQPMGFGEAVLSVFSKYATFSGRASRSVFWYFMLFYLLAVIFLGILGAGTASALLPLVLFLPTLAVQVRRLHDIGRSGWWALIQLIPLVGTIVMIVFMCTAPAPGPSRLG